jgi:hypothetical protein
MDTNMQIAVPYRVVWLDQLSRLIASGCSIITSPAVITTQATISIGPRRSQRGQRR